MKAVKGLKVHRLVLLKPINGDHRHWLCKCSCGLTKVMDVYGILHGRTKSCGCVRRKHTIKRNKSNAIDGLSHSPTGSSWRAAINRCYNQNVPCYNRYGGAGVRMCEYLRASILNLIDVIGERPKGTSIDRINNLGHYSCGSCAQCVANKWPLNVRWATPTQQGRNQKTNHLITINGETKCMSEWAELAGIPYDRLRNRVARGWKGKKLLCH
jgi:hypothetical protein